MQSASNNHSGRGRGTGGNRGRGRGGFTAPHGPSRGRGGQSPHQEQRPAFVPTDQDARTMADRLAKANSRHHAATASDFAAMLAGARGTAIFHKCLELSKFDKDLRRKLLRFGSSPSMVLKASGAPPAGVRPGLEGTEVPLSDIQALDNILRHLFHHCTSDEMLATALVMRDQETVASIIAVATGVRLRDANEAVLDHIPMLSTIVGDADHMNNVRGAVDAHLDSAVRRDAHAMLDAFATHVQAQKDRTKQREAEEARFDDRDAVPGGAGQPVAFEPDFRGARVDPDVREIADVDEAFAAPAGDDDNSGEEDDAAPLRLETRAMRQMRDVTTKHPLTSFDHHLDTVFHLTRADAIEPLRDAIAELRAARDNPQQPRGRNGAHASRAAVTDLTAQGFWSHRDHGFAIALHSPSVQRRYINTKGQAFKRKFFAGNLIMLSMDGFQTGVVGVAAGKSEDLGKGLIWISFPKQPAVGLRVFKEAVLSTPKRLLQLIESPVYWESIAPALKAIQRMGQEQTPLFTAAMGQIENPPQAAPPAPPRRPRLAPFDEDDDYDYDYDDDDDDDFDGGGLYGNGRGARPRHLHEDPRPPTLADVKDTAFVDSFTLDPSQSDALAKIFSDVRIPIVQGPPGTGKTTIGLAALRLMIHESWHENGPVLLVAYTNHALDSLLELLISKEPEFFEKDPARLVRIGAGSKNELVRKRHFIDIFTRNVSGYGRFMEAQKALEKECDDFNSWGFMPTTEDGATDAARDVLRDFERVLEAELESASNELAHAEEQLKCFEVAEADAKRLRKPSPVGTEAQVMAGRHHLTAGVNQASNLVAVRQKRLKFLLQTWCEPNSLRLQPNDESAATAAHDGDEEGARGGVDSTAAGLGDAMPEFDDREDRELPPNFNPDSPASYRRLPPKMRHTLVTTWRETRQRKRLDAVSASAEQSEAAAQQFNARRLDTHVDVLRKARFIAATTTGLAKYLDAIRRVNVECCMVEEAAEVSEAHMLATILPSVKRLILIGDHQQLRPQVQTMLGERKGLNISMMERLATVRPDSVVTLATQRRMRDDVAQYVTPLYERALARYGGLTTHSSVDERSLMCVDFGVAGETGWVHYVSHTFPEVPDESSKRNPQEAKYVVDLARHVARNLIAAVARRKKTEAATAPPASPATKDAKPAQDPPIVTILTPYAGQNFELRSHLKMPPKNQSGEQVHATREAATAMTIDRAIQIATLDDFQGRENEAVILSFTRSNRIGFLKDAHRICVAISRAKNLFVVVGNFAALGRTGQLAKTFWHLVLKRAKEQGHLRSGMLLECRTHGTTTRFDPVNLAAPRVAPRIGVIAPNGGCTKPCGAKRPCGHICEVTCHSADCDDVSPCMKPCARRCDKGHRCSGHPCHQRCPPCAHHVTHTFDACGHTCVLECSSVGAGCTQKVRARHATCKHSMTIECRIARDPAWKARIACEAKCTRKRVTCEHECTAKCSDCMAEDAPQLHHRTPCSHACARVLVCGHVCNEPCSNECPPCQKRCDGACAHQVRACDHACGARCVPCAEPCMVRCPHRACEALCCEPCTVEPCEEPCRKKFDGCKHLCRGLCGEPCPKRCLVCSPVTPKEDAFKTCDPEDAGPDDRFTTLPACGHTFRVEDMDMLVKTQLANSKSIGPLLCPMCRTPVKPDDCPRHKPVLLKRREQIERAKEAIRDRACQLGDALRSARGKLEVLAASLQRRVVPGGHSAVVCEVEAAVAATLHDAKIVPDSNLQLQELLAVRALSLRVLASTLQHVNEKLRAIERERADSPDIAAAIAAVKLLAQGTDVQAVEGHRTDVFRSVMLEMTEWSDYFGIRSQMKLDRRRANVNALSEKELRQRISEYGGLSETEKSDIHKALVEAGSIRSKGAWFECPNGHLYTIGDCGGARSEGKCPTCGATIGGEAYRMAEGNRHTGAMDGSENAAWS